MTVPHPKRTQDAVRTSSLVLENLPAEIRRYLLLTLEYEALKALVHASPVYHQQYLLDRKHLSVHTWKQRLVAVLFTMPVLSIILP